MDLEILKPYPEYLIINKGDYELNEFTLKMITGIIKSYGDLKTFETVIKPQGEITNKILEDFSQAVSFVSWLLLKERDLFPSFCVFKSKFLPLVKNGKTPTKTEREKLKEFERNKIVIDLIVERSKPINVDADKVDHLNKPQSKSIVDKSDYGDLFVYIATKINISLDEFYNLTLRQIHKITNQLQDQEHHKFVQACRLHGIPMEENKKSVKFTKDEHKNLKNVASNMFSNLMKGFKR